MINNIPWKRERGKERWEKGEISDALGLPPQNTAPSDAIFGACWRDFFRRKVIAALDFARSIFPQRAALILRRDLFHKRVCDKVVIVKS